MNSRSKTVQTNGKEVACSQCGATYKLTYSKVTMRDQDRLCCEVCRNEIHRWSEAKVWKAELISKVVGCDK